MFKLKFAALMGVLCASGTPGDAREPYLKEGALIGAVGALVGAGAVLAYTTYADSSERGREDARAAVDAAELLRLRVEQWMRGQPVVCDYAHVARAYGRGMLGGVREFVAYMSSEVDKSVQQLSKIVSKKWSAADEMQEVVVQARLHHRALVQSLESLRRLDAVLALVADLRDASIDGMDRESHYYNELTHRITRVAALMSWLTSECLHRTNRDGITGVPLHCALEEMEQRESCILSIREKLNRHVTLGSFDGRALLEVERLHVIEQWLAALYRARDMITQSSEMQREIGLLHTRKIELQHAAADRERAAAVRARFDAERADAERARLRAERDVLRAREDMQREENRRLKNEIRRNEATAALVESVVDGVLAVTGVKCPYHGHDTSRCPRTCNHYHVTTVRIE